MVERIGATLFLIAYSAMIAIVVAIPLGTIAALRREKASDQAIRVGVLVGIATPTFWIGTLLILLFSLHWTIFPASGYGNGFVGHLHSLLLPAATLSLWQAGLLIRNLRSAIIDVVRLPYVDFARLRGLPAHTVLRRHILRTSMASTVTIIGVNVELPARRRRRGRERLLDRRSRQPARRLGVQPRLHGRAGHHAAVRDAW